MAPFAFRCIRNSNFTPCFSSIHHSQLQDNESRWKKLIKEQCNLCYYWQIKFWNVYSLIYFTFCLSNPFINVRKYNLKTAKSYFHFTIQFRLHCFSTIVKPVTADCTDFITKKMQLQIRKTELQQLIPLRPQIDPNSFPPFPSIRNVCADSTSTGS